MGLLERARGLCPHPAETFQLPSPLGAPGMPCPPHSQGVLCPPHSRGALCPLIPGMPRLLPLPFWVPSVGGSVAEPSRASPALPPLPGLDTPKATKVRRGQMSCPGSWGQSSPIPGVTASAERLNSSCWELGMDQSLKGWHQPPAAGDCPVVTSYWEWP